ncbi:MAG TPA: flagellar cap protein [Gammaproteobacteria bacterium]|nr:flagellar cap protein [Gammaproteobacteria bacterium]
MISSPGLGSGLDVNSIVDQLMAIERQPLDRLEADKRDIDTQLSSLGQLKSALSQFQSTLDDLKSLDALEVYTAGSSDESVFTATANSSAVSTTMTVQVNRLAQAHKMGSQAIADTTTTTVGGSGDTMTITVNGNAFTVNGGGLSLSDLRDAINTAPDNTGVAATLVIENSGSSRLVLTSTETGNANAMSLSFTGTLGTDLGMTDINDPAQLDAEVVLDGQYTITRASNTIDDAISGITLNLTGASATPATLAVARDTESVKASVQSFVDAFNELQGTMDGMRGKETDLDATLRSIESRMRDVFNTVPSGITSSFSYLTEVGVTFQREGNLSLSASDLEAAIDSDFEGMAQLFANDSQGYLFRLDAVVEEFVKLDGFLDDREDSLNTSKRSVENRISDMEFRLQLRERSLLAQFTALDNLMGQLQGTSAFLTQQLAALPSA